MPVSLLTYLADDLVAVHGQSDQQQLLKPGRQRESLDKFAGAVLAEVLADYQRVYNGHRKAPPSDRDHHQGPSASRHRRPSSGPG